MTTSSALITPIPALEPALGAHRARLDAAATLGLPAHCTVLFPFVEAPDDDVRERLRLLMAGHTAFTSRWSRTGWFGHDVLFVEPDDPGPFVALTRTLERAFPDFPAYGGAFDDVHPHVTVGQGASFDVLRRAEEAVAPHLAVEQHVDAVELWAGPVVDGVPAGTWGAVARYPLA